MSDHGSFGWMLFALGLVMAGIGLVWILAPSIRWLGRLPGDIRIEKGNATWFSITIMNGIPRRGASLRKVSETT